MKTARRCLLLASLALAGCASTPSGGLPADAGLRVEPVRPARASLSGVHLDASGRVLSGWIRFGYPDLPRDRPINLVGGGRDPSTNGGKLVTAFAKRLSAMGFSNLTSKVYAETRHESLNEVNRDVIMQDFVSWAEKISG